MKVRRESGSKSQGKVLSKYYRSKLYVPGDPKRDNLNQSQAKDQSSGEWEPGQFTESQLKKMTISHSNQNYTARPDEEWTARQ